MGAGQFLCAFSFDKQIQSKHTKWVTEKGKKDNGKKTKITIQEVREDRLEGKVVTLKQLQALCTKHS